ncbi:BspA family leucine-rich repeat surface protein [Candidatus Saccharibacteria bacterium]|nr:BspA family leucine-rich repeat surface protein [Candidatus Saccharibacteria bacterium]
MFRKIIEKSKTQIIHTALLTFLVALTFNAFFFAKNTEALRVPGIAVSFDADAHFNGNQIINSLTQSEDHPMNLTVTTDNTTGYQVMISAQTNETAMTSAANSDRINSISQNLTLTNFPSNTWGIRLGNYGEFMPIPPASSPIMLVQNSSKPVTNTDTHQVDMGLKLAPNLSSGEYTNTLMVTVITNDYPPRALTLSSLYWRNAMKDTSGGLDKIKHFARSMSPPTVVDNPVHLEDDGTSDAEVLGWFNPASETFYYYSLADKVELNYDSSYMFLDFTNLDDIDLSGLDTRSVINMQGMFRNTGLTSLDLSSFDTENVTDMSGMFYDVKNLTNLDLTHLNTSNVTDMHYMFTNMSSLTSLNLSHMNTSKVTNMTGMFWGVKNLPTLDLSKFDTRNVTDMSQMFFQVEKLANLDLSSFDTSKVTTMFDMFNSMKSLTNLKFSKKFNTGQVQNMQGMFANLMNIQEIELSQADFDTSNVRNFFGMFMYGFSVPSKLQRIYVTASKDFNTSKAAPTNYPQNINSQMFTNQLLLRGSNGSYAPNPALADLSWLRIDRGAAQPGYFTAK